MAVVAVRLAPVVVVVPVDTLFASLPDKVNWSPAFTRPTAMVLFKVMAAVLMAKATPDKPLLVPMDCMNMETVLGVNVVPING
jgi:uncharacterized membrane protein YczE